MVAPMLVNETSITPCGFDVTVVRVKSSPVVGCRPNGFVVMFREYSSRWGWEEISRGLNTG